MSEKMHLRCREQGRTEREEARAKEREEREAARAAEKEERERKRLEALAAKRYPIDDLELLQELSDRAVQCGGSSHDCMISHSSKALSAGVLHTSNSDVKPSGDR